MTDPVILLVEDAPADILLAQRALRKSQIQAQVRIATDGHEAWQLLEDEKDISLILLDLHLPKVNGLHLLERVRQEESTRSVPVIVVTSSELASDRSRAMDFGANGYIAKPINPTKLTQMIEGLNIESLKPSPGPQDE